MLSSNDWKPRFAVAAIFALGVSAVMTQLALLRELLVAFSGSELVLGIILGSWMLLTGLGARAGRAARFARDPEGAIIVALLLIAVVPPLQIVALREFRDVIFIRGALAGITGTAAASLVLLAPYCLVSGGLLTIACRMPGARDGAGGIGRVYLADSIGSVAGGIVFSFVLVRWLDHFALLCIPALLCLAVAGAAAFHFRRRILHAVCVVFVATIAVAALRFDVDSILTRRQFAGQEIVFRGSSPYGRLVVTKDAGQLNFIENGVPMFSTRNEAHIEETVHYAMAQRRGASNVLLIAGGISGTAREILKYPGARVTYVELDPMIVDAGRRLLPGSLDDPRIRVVTTDGRLFVKNTRERYDVIILDVPDPTTAQINRFFTTEFFGEAKRAISDGGVLSFGLGQYASYVSRPLAKMLASADATLRQNFRNAQAIPGGRIYFLASDGELTTDVAGRIEEAGIETGWVRRAYLGAMLAPDRLADLARATQQPAAINRDFNPVLYFYHLVYWMSQFKARLGLLVAAIAIAVVIYALRLRPVPFAIFASGIAASGIEIVLLLAFQILCGSLYRQLGIVITVFMLGLAAGAYFSNRRTGSASRARLAALAMAVAILSAALPLLFHLLQHAGSLAMIKAAISMLTFALAALVGMQFPLAGRIETSDAAASRLYTADFIGGFLGALLPCALIIPLWGVTTACILIAAVNLAAFAALARRRI